MAKQKRKPIPQQNRFECPAGSLQFVKDTRDQWYWIIDAAGNYEPLARSTESFTRRDAAFENYRLTRAVVMAVEV
jgi:hypothetical protein